MNTIKEMDCKVVRLTNGPKNHLFGFHDLYAWNKQDNRILSLEVNEINRPPLPRELFKVGFVEDGIFIPLGNTEALNYPQGARQQWISDSNYFCVNNRVGNTWGTDIYDSDSKTLVEKLPLSTHMLSPDGKFSYGLDYARLFRLGGYGYSGIDDLSSNESLPQNSGITKQNIETKESCLLVSVYDAAKCCSDIAVSESSHHYLTHLSLNPAGTRIAFLHRYFLADGGLMTRLMTIGANGENLRCLAQGFLSHYHWKDNNTLYIYGRANSSVDAIRSNPIFSLPIISQGLKFTKKIVKSILPKSLSTAGKSFMFVTDEDAPIIKSFAKDIINYDGHPMTNPSNNDFCVNDTYPDEKGYRDLMLYRFSTNDRFNLGHFQMIFDQPEMILSEQFFSGVDKRILKSITPELLAFTRSGLHCDLHPRWNANGTKIAFDSIHEGTRQIYCVDVSSILNSL